MMMLTGLATLNGCAPLRAPKVPLATLSFPATAPPGRLLMVLLPGYGSSAKDFDRKGYIAAARSANPAIEVIAVDAHFGYYQKKILIPRLWEDVVRPATTAGYDEIWLIGTSMGGLGALAFTQAHEGIVSGLVLISPYLGPEEIIDEIAAAGGLTAWNPPAEPDIFATIWSWLKGYQNGSQRPEIILAFGEADRLNPGHEILANALSPEQVIRTDGGHGWRYWKPIWETILARRFQGAGSE